MAKEATNQRTAANSTNGTTGTAHTTGSSKDAAQTATKADTGPATEPKAPKPLISALPVSEETLKTTLRAPQAAAAATWTAVRARKILVTGVGAGAVAVATASFFIGRHTAVSGAGPLTRVTGGRL
ncbi:hypothetical protein LHJ74_01525 [Streptomyces sp. N2-109]|uniref:Uncharacterized protein n=1 Tax=Streptomyces gossypii TaxID=2883101 RepID=A0ABT2JL79_9ACTN|nr:hypothetical protein [Streptomyces gossypii]MCT2588632.1 hypothetical protein [Streptomyces gossypii]